MLSRVDLTLREYDAVFTELRQCITLQYSVLGVGFVVLGALLKGAWEALMQGQLATSTFLGLVSAGVDLVIVTCWAAEITRMRRNAMYLTALERDLLAATIENVDSQTALVRMTQFGFHTWARSKGRQGLLVMNYVITFGLLVAAGLLGFAPAAVTLLDQYEGTQLLVTMTSDKGRGTWATAVAAIVVFVCFVSIITFLSWRLRHVDDWPIPGVFDSDRPSS